VIEDRFLLDNRWLPGKRRTEFGEMAAEKMDIGSSILGSGCSRSEEYKTLKMIFS